MKKHLLCFFISEAKGVAFASSAIKHKVFDGATPSLASRNGKALVKV